MNSSAHAGHDIFDQSAPDCSYSGAQLRRQPSDHDSTIADGHTLTNTLRYACWLRSHDAEVAAAARAEVVTAEPAEQNYRRHLLSLDPSPEVRAALDEVVPPPSLRDADDLHATVERSPDLKTLKHFAHDLIRRVAAGATIPPSA